MTNCVAVLATMDTKGEECDFLRQQIEHLGGRAVLIDFGVVGEATIKVDYSNDQVAIKGGGTLAELLSHPSREQASEVMVAGSIALVSELIEAEDIDSIISLGGTQGTSNACRVMQTLPYGFPKIMVSTMASGDTSPYVDIKDITMMFSVSDILGLNPFLRRILSNAAGAAFGMSINPEKIHFDTNKPVVGISNLGVLTQGTMLAVERLARQGVEAIVFHAVGPAGRAMEQMMKEGIITAVFDFALGDIADSLYGGIRAADQNRLTVAGQLGLPQVVVPGGIDHLGILLDQPNTVPEKYKNYIYSYHNPTIFVPRTTGEEMTDIMRVIADRLQHSKSNTVFMLPTKGVSSYSAKGGDLYDPVSDEAFHQAVRQLLPKDIPLIEMDNNAEDEVFVSAAVDQLLALMGINSSQNL